MSRNKREGRYAGKLYNKHWRLSETQIYKLFNDNFVTVKTRPSWLCAIRAWSKYTK